MKIQDIKTMDLSQAIVGEFLDYPILFVEDIDSPAAALKIKGEYYILISPRLSELPEEIWQQSIIYHEIGHMVNGDCETRYIRTLEAEHAADLYSAKQIGFEAVIDTLKYYRKCIKDSELSERILKLQIAQLKNNL